VQLPRDDLEISNEGDCSTDRSIGTFRLLHNDKLLSAAAAT